MIFTILPFLGVRGYGANIGGDAYHLPKEERQPALDQKLKEALRPEFINRIDEIIFFNPLDQNDIFKREMEACLLNRVTISWDEEVIEYLTEKGVSPLYGVRPLERLIQKELQTPVINAVINQNLFEGSLHHFTVQDDQIILRLVEI